MVSKNNSQKRVNRKIKLTRRRVSNSSSKKRTNKRNNSTSTSPSPNKSKKRHFKKRSRKRTTNKTSKKRRKSKNSKSSKANNVLMKGGSKLYNYIFFGKKIGSITNKTVEDKLEELINLLSDPRTITLPLTPPQIEFLDDLSRNHKDLFNIPILSVLDYVNNYKFTNKSNIPIYLFENKDNILNNLETKLSLLTEDQKSTIIKRMTTIADSASSLSNDTSVFDFKIAFKAKIEDNMNKLLLKLNELPFNDEYVKKKVKDFMIHFIVKDLDPEKTKNLKILTFAILLNKMYEGSFEDGISCFPLFGNPDILLFYLLTCSEDSFEVYFRNLAYFSRIIIFDDPPPEFSISPNKVFKYLQKLDFDQINRFQEIYNTSLDFVSNLKKLNHFKFKLSRGRSNTSDSGFNE